MEIFSPTQRLFALTMFHPKPAWLETPRIEALQWLSHRMDQVREHMLSETGSGVLWATTFPSESETLPRPIVLLWNLANRDAIRGLLEQLNRADVQHYFHVAVTSGTTGQSADEMLDAFTADLDR
jgi:hypothetical protein